MGRWYGLFMVDAIGAEVWIGSLRFAPDARIQPGCVTVLEVYGTRPVKPSQIPYWGVSVTPPLGDGKAAELWDTWYGDNVGTLRNTLISVDGDRVFFEVGLSYLPDS